MEILVRLVVAAVVATVLYWVGDWANWEWLHWWVAGLIGLAVAFIDRLVIIVVEVGD